MLDYIKEAERQLSKEDHYQKLEKDPTPLYTTIIKKAVMKMYTDGAINKKSKTSLFPAPPRSLGCIFYLNYTNLVSLVGL